MVTIVFQYIYIYDTVLSYSPTKIIDVLEMIREQRLPLLMEGIWEELEMTINIRKTSSKGLL